MDTMLIPFNDLQRIEPSLEAELTRRTSEVIHSGHYIFGPQSKTFETRFAKYSDCAQCVSLNSGTDALELGLRAIGIGPGDKVITVGNAGPYGSCAIHQIGAQPVFVDIEPTTLNISLEALESALAGDVQAAIITHLYGSPVDLEQVRRVMESRGIPWVEDCAQAHGARWRGQKVGSFATVGCFSFYPTKNLGACGDAGACVTNCEKTAKRLRALRQYGWGKKYHIIEKGGRNSRMDEIQAAVLLAKLDHLDTWNLRRQEISAIYRERLSELHQLRLPQQAEGSVSHLFVVAHPKREELRLHLAERGVTAAIHYPVPDPGSESLPQTKRACAQVLSLPCFPALEDREVVYICDQMRELV
jgi:dTDP-4-amino-4,6-dideoxygalactose transaminase